MVRPTASGFDRIITSTGRPSDQSRRYMFEIIFQRIYGIYACPPRETPAMIIGKKREAEALAHFRELTAKHATPGLFLTTDDGKVGCSPDATVGYLPGQWEGVEIKCPDGWRHMQYAVCGPMTDYKPQLQGQMLVGEFSCVHFFSYHPSMPCVAYKIGRDEPYIRELDRLLKQFVKELDATEAKIRALGNYDALPSMIDELTMAQAIPAEPDAKN